MASITNTWIGYITRSYQQIKDAVLTQMQSRVPEITDHTEGNLFVKLIGIWSGIAEMLGYYIDNGAREAFLSTCRFYSSGIKIARLLDYKVLLNSPAITTVIISIPTTYVSDLTIPQGTIVKTEDGVIKFRTVNQIKILAGTLFVSVDVVQSEVTGWLTVADACTGLPNQEILLGAETAVHNSVILAISGVVWTSVDTFAFSTPTDKHFRVNVNEDKKIVIQFGDGQTGLIPTAGTNVAVAYLTTLGSAGNGIAVDAITKIDFTGPRVYSVRNTSITNSGYDVESLDDLRRHIPVSLRTQMRAVTKKDYEDLASLVVGVEKAGVEYNYGYAINLYIVPISGGLATSALCQSVVAWMSGKSILTHVVTCTPAGIVYVKWDIVVTVYPEYSRDTVKQAVKDALVAHMTPNNQELNGGIKISDIYQVIESVEGVQNSTVQDIIAVPFAHKLTGTVDELNWECAIINQGNTKSKWKITMVSNAQFQVLKDNTFVGNYLVDNLIIRPEIEFKLIGLHTIGSSWEFIVYPNPYPNYGSIQLDEMSILATLSTDVTVSTIGGV